MFDISQLFKATNKNQMMHLPSAMLKSLFIISIKFAFLSLIIFFARSASSDKPDWILNNNNGIESDEDY